MPKFTYSGYGRIYKSIFLSPALTAAQKGVYAALAAYAGEKGEAFPHQERLAFELSIGIDTLRRHLKALEKEQVLQIKRTAHGNRYQLTPQKGGWGIMPKKIVQDPTLPLISKALYGCLACYAGTDGQAHPHRGTLLRGLSMGKDRFYKALHALSEKDYVEVITRREGSRFTSSLFLLKGMHTAPPNPPHLVEEEKKGTTPEKELPKNLLESTIPSQRQETSVSEKTLVAYNKEININTPFTINRQTKAQATRSVEKERKENRPKENGIAQILLEIPFWKNPTVSGIAPLPEEKQVKCLLLENRLEKFLQEGLRWSYKEAWLYAERFLE